VAAAETKAATAKAKVPTTSGKEVACLLRIEAIKKNVVDKKCSCGSAVLS